MVWGKFCGLNYVNFIYYNALKDGTMKKKKVAKKKKPVKQKIDVVLESLLNLEQRTKELIKRVEELERLTFSLYYKRKDDNKYWPNTSDHYNNIKWDYSRK